MSASLTEIADERQLDFIPAFERIVQQVYADRDAATLLPKALRSYCAVVCHHLSQGDRYPSTLQHKLRTASTTSLAQLPSEPLQAVIADMDAERAASLSQLLATA